MDEFQEAAEGMFEGKRKHTDFEKLIKMLAYRNDPRRIRTWLCRHPSTFFNSTQYEKLGSYLKLPEDYPWIISTGRDPHTINELNNKWISVATGSEDFSFKVMRKNQYEEQLFNCEDERFELDMTINGFTAAIETLEKIQREAQAAQTTGKKYAVDPKILTSIRLKPVYEIYGEVAEGMMENLVSQPLRAAPLMLKRLGNYRNGYLQQKKRQEEIWRECCEKNFYKSLDHKSFYFRQSEKKNTNTKG